MSLKIFAISDTHTCHHLINVPECDILLHAGDSTFKGTYKEIMDFLYWLVDLTHVKHKVIIPGNHDFGFQNPNIMKEINFKALGINFLIDSMVEIEGIKIYGTPWTPFFHDWAFNGIEFKKGIGNTYPGGPGKDAVPDKEHPYLPTIYANIPSGIDIVLSHGPCYGILDRTEEGLDVGSNALLEAIYKTKPKAFIHGHVHEAVGSIEKEGIKFFNVSSLDRRYNLLENNIKEIIL